MPAKKFSLKDGGLKDLVISWKRSYRDTKVFCKGELICSFPGRQELEDGGRAQLPDGSELDVSLRRGELILLRDGLPVPGSSKSAHQIVKHAVYAFNAMALITFILGAYMIFSVDDPEYLFDSAIFGAYGLLFTLCGYFTGQGRKLAIFFGLFLTFFYVWFWGMFIANQVSNIAALIFLVAHVFIVMKIIKAIPAIKRFSLYVTPE